MNTKFYLKFASAQDAIGTDRRTYRRLEMIPGALAWGTLVGIFIVSYAIPVWAAFFIILFDIYWLVKTIFLSLHLRANLKRMRANIATDWMTLLVRLKWEHLWQLV